MTLKRQHKHLRASEMKDGSLLQLSPQKRGFRSPEVDRSCAIWGKSEPLSFKIFHYFVSAIQKEQSLTKKHMHF
jgi:hypothetical protein